jgi:hypothetical protein
MTYILFSTIIMVSSWLPIHLYNNTDGFAPSTKEILKTDKSGGC